MGRNVSFVIFSKNRSLPLGARTARHRHIAQETYLKRFFYINLILSIELMQIWRKNDLIEKLTDDFKSYSPKQVQEEAEKFMMDAEGVNMYIRYLKDKEENPDKYARQALENELSLYVHIKIYFTLDSAFEIPVAVYSQWYHFFASVSNPY